MCRALAKGTRCAQLGRRRSGVLQRQRRAATTAATHGAGVGVGARGPPGDGGAPSASTYTPRTPVSATPAPPNPAAADGRTIILIGERPASSESYYNPSTSTSELNRTGARIVARHSSPAWKSTSNAPRVLRSASTQPPLLFQRSEVFGLSI